MFLENEQFDMVSAGQILGFLDKEALAEVVRKTFVNWAKKQPDPKSYWLEDWQTIQATQPEQANLDREIANAVAEATLNQLMKELEELPSS